MLRLQWSATPQPLLSHGRGAQAGRRSGLPAPGWLASEEWNRGWTVLPLRARPAGHPSLRHPESRASGAEPAMRNVLVPGLTPGPPPCESLVFRDHRRGDPGWTSPGLNHLEATPPIQTSGGGHILTSASQGVGRNVPSARSLECSRSSTVGEGFLREEQPGGLPAGSGQALASGCHSGWSVNLLDCLCLFPAVPDTLEQKLPRPRETPRILEGKDQLLDAPPHYNPSHSFDSFTPLIFPSPCSRTD